MQSPRWKLDNKENQIHLDNSRVHKVLETAETMRKWWGKDWSIHLIDLISVHVIFNFLDGPRQFWQIGDLLIRIMSSSRWQTYLRMPLWMGFKALYRVGFGDWSGWSETVEISLLNDSTKSFNFPWGIKIEWAVITFCIPYNMEYSCESPSNRIEIWQEDLDTIFHYSANLSKLHYTPPINIWMNYANYEKLMWSHIALQRLLLSAYFIPEEHIIGTLQGHAKR
jgi:hypothetical protein